MVPHAVHDARSLKTMMGNYIDQHKVKGLSLEYEEPVPSSLAKEYSTAVAFSKEDIERVL